MANWITGREIIAAAKKAAAWRTAVACGAGDGVLITRDSMGPKSPTFVDDNSLGQAEISKSIQTSESLTGGSWEGLFRYEGWDLLLALALGTSTYAAGANSKEHLYTPSASTTGLFATLAMKKTGTTHDIWEIPSAKVTGFTIRGRVGELCTVNFTFSGSKIESESTTNTTATMANVTYPLNASADGQVKMDANTSILMNAAGAGALAGGDQIYPTEFELSYERPIDEPFEAGYADMSEPAQNDFGRGTINLSFDKYGIDEFTDAISAGTNQKMKLTLEGAIIGGSDTYKFDVYLPNISFQSVNADVPGPGPVPLAVEGRLLATDAAPAGFTGILGGVDVKTSLGLYIRNDVADPLA